MKTFPNGCVAVRLVLSPELIAFAQTQWQARGHPNVEDYLNTLLNTALFHEECRAEDEVDAAQPRPGVRDDFPEPVFAPEPARPRKHASMTACNQQEPLF